MNAEVTELVTALPNISEETVAPPVLVEFDLARNPVGIAAQQLAADAGLKRINGKSFTIKNASDARSDEFHVNPYLLQFKPGWNARNMDDPANMAHIDTLAKSIASVGVKETMTVVLEDNQLYVTNGHMRLLATFRAIEVYGATDLKTVPVKTEGRYANEEDHVLSMITRNAGKPLSPMEKAIVYRRLFDFGWSEAQISAKSGETVTHVKQLLQLQAAPSPIRKLISSGKASATLVMETIKEQGTEQAGRTLKAAVAAASAEGKDRATARHVAAVAPQPKAPAEPKQPKSADPLLALRVTIQMGMRRAVTDGSGNVTLKFEALEYDKLKRLVAG